MILRIIIRIWRARRWLRLHNIDTSFTPEQLETLTRLGIRRET